MSIRINSNFDSGAIDVLSAEDADNIRLRIAADAGGEFRQWFHFRVSGIKGEQMVLKFEDMDTTAYPPGWENYKCRASYDRETWFQVDTEFDGKTMTVRHMGQADTIYFAYFAPYCRERQLDLIAEVGLHPACNVEVLGETLDGQDLDMLIIGDDWDHEKLKIWFIARQHPGETQASWWMEGMLRRLLDDSDPVSRSLLQKCVFYVVPNMNPDGSKRGYLRTNAAGANLNREWATPSMETSPEVFLVDQEMREIGLDFCLDVHGDESIPYCFIANADAIPNCDPRLINLRKSYEANLAAISPDFQTEHGYPETKPGEANLTIASAHIQNTHQALTMTLEMPFKDNDDMPDEFMGWSPERSRKLGQACLDALWAVHGDLRK
ncbi:M14 family metallopeptidase [Curvivirga sp.]|uniref:M14 family metallopeptidase n=1 Tax=Curvivirga sp. TaxID=2856848 RepID=UPI003B59A2C1